MVQSALVASVDKYCADELIMLELRLKSASHDTGDGGGGKDENDELLIIMVSHWLLLLLLLFRLITMLRRGI